MRTLQRRPLAIAGLILFASTLQPAAAAEQPDQSAAPADAEPPKTAAEKPAPTQAKSLLPPAKAYGELSQERVAYGRYLTLAGDCAACHTREGGEPFEGGLAIDTPFGTLYTANITPARGYGIGHFSDEQFLRALQHGIRPDGQPYYPALPYPSYTKVKDDDLLAIKDYLFSLDPSHYQPPKNNLRWPFDVRDLLFGWQMLYLEDARFEPNPSKSDAWNRGAYLVEGLAHCGSCHTPRNLAGATKDKDALSGAFIDGWYAPKLSGDLHDGLGDWTEADIVTYLRTGEAPADSANEGPQTAALGPMAEVVHESTSELATADLEAMAVYLKDLPAKAEPDYVPPVPHQLSEQDYIQGRKLYQSYCTTCHQSHGRGLAPYFPALAGNEAVTLDTPNDVIETLLLGAPADPSEAYSQHVVMPSFGSILSDQQIATLASYIRANWGNDAAPVTAEQVAKLRGAQ
jgi:mono/diheme cytochrome c family protein